MDIEQISLAQLARHCREQTEDFRRRKVGDDRALYCLEIFRRALQRHRTHDNSALSDNTAAELLVRIYTPFIEANLNTSILSRSEKEEEIQNVWLRFWSAAQSEKGLSFQRLEEALAYLKRIAYTVMIDFLKNARETYIFETLKTEDESQSLDQSISHLSDKSLDPVFDTIKQHLFFARARELIPDTIEWDIFTRICYGFPPRHIAENLKREQKFLGKNKRVPTPRAISDLVERLFRRLAEDEQIKDILTKD